MLFLRWLPTLLAFPLGGLIAVNTVGSVGSPGAGALAGLIAGAILGAAQWLALRPLGVDARWILVTTVAMSAGTALATALTDAATNTPALVSTGLVVGAVVGSGQAFLLGRGVLVAGVWATAVAVSWAAAWFVTANVIVDADRQFVSFGSSGALLATVVTGLVLVFVVAPATSGATASAPVAGDVSNGAVR